MAVILNKKRTQLPFHNTSSIKGIVHFQASGNNVAQFYLTRQRKCSPFCALLAFERYVSTHNSFKLTPSVWCTTAGPCLFFSNTYTN